MIPIRFLDQFPVFHLYNRSNDRQTLFSDHREYMWFIDRVRKYFPPVASILGYCIMPNHFHLLLTPKQAIREEIIRTGKPLSAMPSPEISEAVRRTLMGFTKKRNYAYDHTGSRFQQRTRCKFHSRGLAHGLEYVHQNPVRAEFVGHPSEWGYSSYNEYFFRTRPEDCLSDVLLGRRLLTSTAA
ncbi:hypothetical protein [Lewinella sp. IMCC34183]|uniref:hypothetical protein n=1 Tax=Lewinella sp. IMCC34183 TaxID=2248762 RepID=UPI000E27B576|nr:hypothetical protein [Lewinella sp. IMCC34183]